MKGSLTSSSSLELRSKANKLAVNCWGNTSLPVPAGLLQVPWALANLETAPEDLVNQEDSLLCAGFISVHLVWPSLPNSLWLKEFDVS